ncbi:MAG: hypothetical protein VKI63_06965 [Cyanobium sp.]|nr:hypothetical protein [Cyanobium sp.]
MPRLLKGIAYGSAWVLIWGTVASVVDLVLLEREVYAAGSEGQLLTFASYGLAATVLAARLSGRFLQPPD